MFEPPEFHPRRPGIVAPVRVDGAGRAGPTRMQARGSAWRRTSHGFYVPAWTDATDPQQRILEAAAVLPGYGGVSGWAALRWMGGRWFSDTDSSGRPRAVTLATGDRTRPQPGLAISEERLAPGDLTVVDGLRVTTAVRSVCFAMRYAPSLLAAVTVLDMAAYSDLISIDELAAYALDHPGWTGIPRCRDAIPHADENAWSPMEVEMRWVWACDVGLPRPLCNRPVFDRHGRHVGTPDLIDPVAGVVGQYDGGVHLAGRQRAKDLRQEAAYRALGLECVTMVAEDRRDAGRFGERLRQAYARAARLPAADRLWTVTPPSWWIATTSVARRRALDDGQRERLLRYRLAG